MQFADFNQIGNVRSLNKRTHGNSARDAIAHRTPNIPDHHHNMIVIKWFCVF